MTQRADMCLLLSVWLQQDYGFLSDVSYVLLLQYCNKGMPDGERSRALPRLIMFGSRKWRISKCIKQTFPSLAFAHSSVLLYYCVVTVLSRDNGDNSTTTVFLASTTWNIRQVIPASHIFENNHSLISIGHCWSPLLSHWQRTRLCRTPPCVLSSGTSSMMR
jgi:hypothetical protein